MFPQRNCSPSRTDSSYSTQEDAVMDPVNVKNEPVSTEEPYDSVYSTDIKIEALSDEDLYDSESASSSSSNCDVSTDLESSPPESVSEDLDEDYPEDDLTEESDAEEFSDYQPDDDSQTSTASTSAMPDSTSAPSTSAMSDSASTPSTSVKSTSDLWSSNISSFSATEASFKSLGPIGPKNIPESFSSKSSTIDFLSLFWDDRVWGILVEMTNRHGKYLKEHRPSDYYAKDFEDITSDEMKAFFSLKVAMEIIISKERNEMYWSRSGSWLTSTPGFGKVMSRDRFHAIWSLLRCVDENDLTVDMSDLIYQNRPVLNIIIQNFQKYYVPDCELSLDEGMVPMKNSLDTKKYSRDNAIKSGIQTFLLCESKTGFILNADIYTINDQQLERKIGANGCLVARLSEPYKNRGHCLFMDRFYTSVSLAEYLLEEQDTRICGTVLTSRKGFPKELIKQTKPHRGSSSLLYNGKVAAVVWTDKKPEYFLSTKYVSDPNRTVLCYNSAEDKRLPLPCPALVKAYDHFTGGIGQTDPLTKLRRCNHHCKWPRRLTIKMFVWSAYNAYIIHNYYKHHQVSGKRQLDFHLFVEKLVHELVGTCSRRERLVSTSRNLTNEMRLVNTANFPVHLCERPEAASGNNRCYVCSEKYNRAKRANPGAKNKDLPIRRRSVFWCKTCKVFLCVGVGRNNCFHIYHSKVEYWT